MPLHVDVQLYSLALEILYFRFASLTKRPPFISFNILTVRDSLYCDFFIVFSVSPI